jgi:hypothetical protein
MEAITFTLTYPQETVLWDREVMEFRAVVEVEEDIMVEVQVPTKIVQAAAEAATHILHYVVLWFTRKEFKLVPVN